MFDIARMHIEEECSFKWGENDCVLWVCDYLRKLHGVDYAKDYRGKYNCQLGARRIMRGLGHFKIEDLVGEYLRQKSIRLATRGDIVLSHNGALGICLGYHSYFLGTGGVTNMRTQLCTTCWSVK